MLMDVAHIQEKIHATLGHLGRQWDKMKMDLTETGWRMESYGSG
jgi:hypothetical protein